MTNINTREIITGQKVSEGKRLRAQVFRREPTPAEEILWRHLRGERQDGLHFRRQQNLDGFIADFYCHQAGLVIEVDGKIHETRADYDAERDRIFGERGLRVLRVTNDDAEKYLPATLLRIRAEAKKRITEKRDSTSGENGEV